MKFIYSASDCPIGALVCHELLKDQTGITTTEGKATKLDVGSVTLTTDVAVCRYLAQSAPSAGLYGSGLLEEAEVENWLLFAATRLSCTSEFSKALAYLNSVLGPVAYLVGNRLTVADCAVWGALRGSAGFQHLLSNKEAPCHVARYYEFLSNNPAFKGVDSAMPKTQPKAPTAKKSREEGEAKQEGKFVDLPGAEMGKVVVRFPPEASGYLHIGHAKAALLNQYYQQAFKGKLIMRFDDTNPAKESSEFEKVILEDVKQLGVNYDIFTHTSDSFDLIQEMCERMIREDKAYADDTEPELMKKQRELREASANRANSVEKNLSMWEEMKKGSGVGVKCCVRAKIDPASNNGCMRDPTMFRCKPETHVRTGNKYKVYPTYDFACPIVDSVEGVTHALRTTEYNDRDCQYYWFIDQLGLRKPTIYAYSRLNLQNTVLSKRKLTWFVNEGIVDGWDDPRFPTVKGVLRRGMTVEGLKQFIVAQGSSRSINMMEWDKIWSYNKKVIDPVVPRFTALGQEERVPLNIRGAKAESSQVNLHPKDATVGQKTVVRSPRVFLDGADAATLAVGTKITLINWGNVVITAVNKDGSGKITSLDADAMFDDTDFKKTVKLTWLADEPNRSPLVPLLCIEYENIITKGILDKEDDFKDFVNRDSKHETLLVGEPPLQALKKGDIIQLQRRGYFICDSPFQPPSRHTSRATPAVLIAVPDGREKSTATASEKGSSSSKKKGKEAKPAKSAGPSTPAGSGGGDVAALDSAVRALGEKVRQLKSDKADKAAIKAEVDKLLAAKADFKKAAGKDWSPDFKPAAAAAPTSTSTGASTDVGGVDAAIRAQGDLVRKLKGEKAAKDVIKAAVDKLLALKADFKKASGQDWKPDMQLPQAAAAPAPAASAGGDVRSLDAAVRAQGDLVRKLKGEKAPKDEVKAAVDKLLALKVDFKKASGQDWKPDMQLPQAAVAPAPAANATSSGSDVRSLDAGVRAQGDLVRKLKTEKAPKDEIKAAVDRLLALKADFKKASGLDWKPDIKLPEAPATSVDGKVSVDSAEAVALKQKVDSQGLAVRDLKGAKVEKAKVDAAVAELLALKAKYKTLTGVDFAGGGRGSKKPQSAPAPAKKAAPAPTPAPAGDGKDMKKQTRLGMEAKKEENLSEWYSQVITKAEMIEYYDVSGCYVLRPWSFSIWDVIRDFFDAEIKKTGVENAYFPIFVSQAALEREKSHIADFAPEVAWVTRSGNSELAEPIAVRPTSETVMYPAYAKWIRSHRDLPLKLNQWNNVVRWEFKQPTPFLRTREFLWQEGHTAFATREEAVKEVYVMLDLYAQIYEDYLAVPVVKGKKTEKEKFAGGDFTTTVEAYIEASGRGIQGATSHHLGQNFSKMFGIQFEGTSGEMDYVHQNSWGITTRTIGVMTMVHGDNKGLVLPPMVARFQVVVVPCGITASMGEAEREKLLGECRVFVEGLQAAGMRVKDDFRDNYSPGWKFNHWELKGVPIRVELGPRDLAAKQFVTVRRDTGEKTTSGMASAAATVKALLEDIQKNMFQRAKKVRDEHLVTKYDWDGFCSALDNKCLICAPFCGQDDCETFIKAESARGAVVEEGAPAMGAKTLCIPLDQPGEITADMKCINPKCSAKPQFFTMFGRSY